MTTFARVVVPGCPHHLLQRGNRKADVFQDDSDRLVYLRLLRDASELHRISVWTYTLMDNHVHAVAVPEHEDSFAKAIRDTHGEYSRYFNSKYALVGHVWQGRFKSIVLEEEHAWNACRYVELNPVRAGMVRRAEDYQWSSAAAHCGLRDDPLISSDCPLIKEIKNWSEWLSLDNPIGFDKMIRDHTRTGRPMGSNEFIRQLESKIGRKLLPQKRGRPPKRDSDDQKRPNSASEPPCLFE